MNSALDRGEMLARTDAISAILEHVVARTGLTYYRGRERAFTRHLHRAMRRAAIRVPEHYLALIRSERGRDELETLVAELVIGETSFFRHPDQFTALRDEILPALARARPDGHALRLWSAACANGAEAASLAMLVACDPVLRERAVSILASDLSRDAVRRARRLVFAERDRRGLPPELDRACFEDATDSADGEGARRLADPFREMLRFRQHNLLSAAHPEGARGAPFDLVLCRNVLIYFDAPTVRHVLGNIRALMAPDGWLVVGHAEPLLSCHDLFRPEWVGSTYAYRPADGIPARRVRLAWRGPNARLIPPWRSQAASAAPAKTVGRTEPRNSSPDMPRAAAPEPQDPSSRADTTQPAIVAELYELMRDGRHEEAERLCHARLEAAPFDPWSHYCDALLLEWKGESVSAETALRRTLFLDRKFALARFRRSQLLMARGEQYAALRELRNVANLYVGRDASEMASEIDGLTVGALRDLVALQLESLVKQ